MNEDSQRDARIAAILALEERMHRAVTPGAGNAWLGAHLSMRQVQVLFVLQRTEGATLNGLARELGITPASTSEVVERLVGLGLVARESDPLDRRRVRLGLADEARRILVDLQDAGRVRLARLLSVMDEEELALVQRSMEVMIVAARRLPHAPASEDEP